MVLGAALCGLALFALAPAAAGFFAAGLGVVAWSALFGIAGRVLPACGELDETVGAQLLHREGVTQSSSVEKRYCAMDRSPPHAGQSSSLAPRSAFLRMGKISSD